MRPPSPRMLLIPVLLAAVAGIAVRCTDNGTSPDPDSAGHGTVVFAEYLAFAPGNAWHYDHTTPDTASYGSHLEEFVGAPVMLDSFVCMPITHAATGSAYPDTSFVSAANPLLLKGFAWRGLRFEYRPHYRLAPDSARVGDTLTFTYAVALAGEDTALAPAQTVRIEVCCRDSSPVHTEHFRDCILLRIDEENSVEWRWLMQGVGTVASELWHDDTLTLSTKLTSATIGGGSRVFR